MTRQPQRLDQGGRGKPQPGIRAFFTGDCPCRPEPIIRNVSRISPKRGEWRHTHCMSGADDE